MQMYWCFPCNKEWWVGEVELLVNDFIGEPTLCPDCGLPLSEPFPDREAMERIWADIVAETRRSR
jgi:hypothetical protein